MAVRVALVWVASYFVPAGAYDIDPKAGGPVPGSYHEIPSCANAQRNESRVETAFDQRLGQLWSAPPTRSGETLSFFVLLVPLTLALGYDRMVTASIIFVGGSRDAWHFDPDSPVPEALPASARRRDLDAVMPRVHLWPRCCADGRRAQRDAAPCRARVSCPGRVPRARWLRAPPVRLRPSLRNHA